jgi:glycerol-1-phosphatase
VLYLGEQPVPHAADSVAEARDAGMAVAFVTNNASRAPDRVASLLSGLGIPARAEDVVTSGQAAVRLVAERVPAGSATLVVGSVALEQEVTAAGLRAVRTVAEAGPAGPAAVVQGLARETTWRDLAEASVAVRRGAFWVAGNVDSTLPSPDGPLPGNGTMVEAVRTATGAEPVVAGKPEPALHEESVRRTGSRRPLVVGDRLDTDVLGAVRAGAASLLVLTGVVDLAGALAAPEGSRPSFVGPDLRCLHLPQPEVVTGDGVATCGPVRARLDDDGVLRVQPTPRDDAEALVAALRTVCALAWESADRGLVVARVEGLPG